MTERGEEIPMPEWRTSEYGGDASDLVGEIDVMPGHPDVLRRIERLQFAVDRSPHDWQSRVALAQALAQNGEFDRSVGHLRSSIELVSDRQSLASIFFNLGVCLESQDRWSDAAIAYEQCAFLMPHLFWVHYNLGVCLHRSGRLSHALDELRLAQGLDSEIPDVYRSLAETYMAAGMMYEAERACHRLLEMDPESIWALRTLHNIRRQMN
jgi:tetratricopeptide (TPR) repeat protein